VADRLKLSHIKWEIKPEVADLWPRLLYHLDEPIADPAAIACYLISKLARNNQTKVLLSGQGADELFAGYPRYRVMNATSLSDCLPSSLKKLVAWGGSSLPGAREGKFGAYIRRIRRVLVSLEKNPDRRFMSYCANTPDEAVLGILSPEVRRQIGAILPSDQCIRHMDQVGLTGVDRWLERDLTTYLPNHNLLYTDKMSMAAGVETRVPLLDLELVNMVTAMPVDWKVRGGMTKAILRDACRGIVPDKVIDRPKAGFGAPYRKWLRYDLAEMWEDLTSERVVQRRGWFDHLGLKRIRELSQTGKQDLYMLQWAVLTIELWARQFIDRNPAKEV
jgi:asparagine synthase (glutamine-hydrolysing)